jgi:hypothetical protein
MALRVSRQPGPVRGGLPVAALHFSCTPSQRGRIRAPWHRPIRSEGSGVGMVSFRICTMVCLAAGGFAALPDMRLSAQAGASNAPLQDVRQKTWAEEVSEAIRRGKPAAPAGPSTGATAPSPGRDGTRSNPRASDSTQGRDIPGASGQGSGGSSQGPGSGGSGQGGGRGQQGEAPGSGLRDRADPETVKALGRGMGKATATRAAPGRINPTASL